MQDTCVKIGILRASICKNPGLAGADLSGARLDEHALHALPLLWAAIPEALQILRQAWHKASTLRGLSGSGCAARMAPVATQASQPSGQHRDELQLYLLL